MDEMDARLACHLLSLPNTRLSAALHHFESALNLISADPASLKHFFPESNIVAIYEWRTRSNKKPSSELQRQRKMLGQLNAALISVTDAAYPPLLKEIPDPPALLYVAGDARKLSQPQIAIVGSRKMTPAGGRLAENFAYEFAKAGLVVTSGMALGVDTQAHRGALRALEHGETNAGSETNTIAVLGTGIDGRYPKSNLSLYQRALEAGAVLVSEYSLGTPPRAGNFPKRNRIITGLSMGTLVVEASEKSGSLISARLAAEQGREVFAVPGSVYSPASAGCHHLIREGATLVTDSRHVLEGIGAMFDLVFDSAPMQGPNNEHSEKAEPSRHWLVDILGNESLLPDEISEYSGRPIQEVVAAITDLEIQGVIASGSQGYQRIN